MDLPADLIALERAAITAHAQYASAPREDDQQEFVAWREAATAVQQAITEHASAQGLPRAALEADV
ncbi:hypothetical protein OYE22_28550 [Streptomyces sp. 71268]|uniref:hypothetical protein n=1 Tax=Streptomyces sp. 71268 TaxID=3002640 RepID=UPI0023F8DF18|nr:hypothetical protein [Streptomyces sp. 71268]WEV28693.1 hypothetical protein OYE22_28550 [Streptomyces sp. 71268]